MMRVKEIYSIPRIEVIPMQPENLLETISLPVNNGSSSGGGDAKDGYFEEELEDEDSAFGMSRPASMTNYSPWAEE
jgi:putative uncharacterized protein (fragment)